MKRILAPTREPCLHVVSEAVRRQCTGSRGVVAWLANFSYFDHMPKIWALTPSWKSKSTHLTTPGKYSCLLQKIVRNILAMCRLQTSF